MSKSLVLQSQFGTDMALGFGSTTQTCDQYIQNYLKQNKNRTDPRRQQEEWYNDYSSRNYSYSLSDLLAPPHVDLLVEIDPVAKKAPSHAHLILRTLARCGYWALWVNWDSRNKYWDITIAVRSGNILRFHPDVIQEDITRKYGHVVYKQWQAMVMDDLDSLQTLVNEVRDRIDFVAPSVVCCERSARLCRRVGIPVKGQFAFLFPSSYSL